MDKIFSQQELRWLDDVFPEDKKRAKADKNKDAEEDEMEVNIFLILNPPACCHLFVVGGIVYLNDPIAMLAGVFILLLGPPKPDRLKDRGPTK